MPVTRDDLVARLTEWADMLVPAGAVPVVLLATTPTKLFTVRPSRLPLDRLRGFLEQALDEVKEKIARNEGGTNGNGIAGDAGVGLEPDRGGDAPAHG